MTPSNPIPLPERKARIPSLVAALQAAAVVPEAVPTAPPVVTLPLTADTAAPVRINGIWGLQPPREARTRLTRKQRAAQNRNRMARASRKRNR